MNRLLFEYIPEGFQPVARGMRRRGAEHTTTHVSSEISMQQSHRLKGEGAISGFVLMTLLILLMAVSLLGISAMNSSLLQLKMTDNFGTGFRYIYDADRILQRAETSIARYSHWSCYLNVTAAEHVLKIKNTEGLSSLNSCRVSLSDNRVGYYVIQPMPDEIAQICVDGKQIDKVLFYRITGWISLPTTLNPKSKGEGILLQSTYAKLLGQRVQKNCMQLPRIPESTRLSLRLLT